mmetsp:Transcript_18747/g.42855  ORF Transcript_18747/g.42855 Transcript_18747/m.42855 type:complete len:247 (+) Transcript_18747:505-1245(+)
MPTLRATVAPNTPPTDPPTSTLAPTSVMVDTYSFEPVADTHVYLDGPYSTQIRGHEERLWVQRGNKESTKPGQEVTLPTIVTLLQFDTKNVSGNGKALPKRSRWPKTEDQVKVTLQINHVPKDDPEYTEDQPVEDMPPVEIEILRLPNNYNYVFESFTGEDFRVAPKVVKEGISITRQSVEATDTQLNIDITPAIFLPEDTTGYGDDQVLLLLKVYWEEKSHEGELFQSRESAGGSPKLLFSNMVE